jgi:hypothetical protein
MIRQFDPVTVALTGQLFFILVASAVLALIASYLLLRLYRRAVIKSMRRVGRSEILEPKGYLPPEPEHKPHDAPLNFNFIVRRALKANRKAISLYRSAIRRRWLAAFVHMIGGCCFAAVMTATFLLAGKLAFSPFRFLYITWANAWPILIAIDLAVGFRRGKWIGFLIYFLVGGILGSISLAKSPDLKLAELLYFWLDVNAPPTILLLIFLNRRIRAVGPLVLVFMILGVTGATLFATLIGNNFKLLKVLSDFTYSIGLSATGTVIALHLIGFAAFAIVGWLILGSLRRLYEKKYLSEHSITVDAVWLLFGIANSIGLVFEGRLWIFSGIAAFIVYKFIGAGLFHLLRVQRRAKINSPRLLFLRVFALGKRSASIFDAVGRFWRAIGSIQMIAGPDLATAAVEPHEFLDFLSRKLDRRFIDSGRTLDLRMDQLDLQPDGDGQFRVTEFFCHDDTWKLTLARLADESDAVLMDLRAFSRSNAGCVFEINELFNLAPLQRLVFIVDESTDQKFMRETMAEAWKGLRDRSPNRRMPAGEIYLVELTNASAMKNLFVAICAAARPRPVQAGERAPLTTGREDDREFSW